MSDIVTRKINQMAERMLPDNDQWTNRFEIRSETSNSLDKVAQNKRKRHWACSCRGFIRWRRCKHLDAIGLPCFEKPHEVGRLSG